MDAHELDLATLAALAGDASSRHVLAHLALGGHAGIRASHGYVFQRLLTGEPTISELSVSLGITQQGTSKHVAELERLGLVERRPDADDSRARRVALTPAAHAAIDAARGARRRLDDELVARFGVGDVETARRVLAGLLDVTGESARVRDRSMPMRPE